MGVRHSGSRIVIGLTLAIVMLMGLPAASAFASAKVRLVNARAGGQAVGLKVVVGDAPPPAIRPADHGQGTPCVNVTPGSASIAISGLSGSTGGSDTQTTQDLTDGKRYTAVALAKGSKGF